LGRWRNETEQPLVVPDVVGGFHHQALNRCCHLWNVPRPQRRYPPSCLAVWPSPAQKSMVWCNCKVGIAVQCFRATEHQEKPWRAFLPLVDCGDWGSQDGLHLGWTRPHVDAFPASSLCMQHERHALDTPMACMEVCNSTSRTMPAASFLGRSPTFSLP
jgi:hypothetical protein